MIETKYVIYYNIYPFNFCEQRILAFLSLVNIFSYSTRHVIFYSLPHILLLNNFFGVI